MECDNGLAEELCLNVENTAEEYDSETLEEANAILTHFGYQQYRHVLLTMYFFGS